MWKQTWRAAVSAAAMCVATALPSWAGDLLYDIDVPTDKSTNITEVIGAEYGDFNKRGGGMLILSAANEFTGNVTNGAGGVIVADPGVGIPATACHVFLSGIYAPLTQTTFTSSLGTGPGEFDMTHDHFKIAALNGPLTINFGGNAEPVVSGGPMNPNAKAFHFGWKDNNNEYPITVLNPLVVSSKLILRTQRNAPVTLAGGVRKVDGVTGVSLDMPDAQPSQFRFTDTGTLNIPGIDWNAFGNGTTTFDGGSHVVGTLTTYRHALVLTNGARLVTGKWQIGRNNAAYTSNIYSYDGIITNSTGETRLGSASGARGNFYMKGGEYASIASGNTSLIIGDNGPGAFYQESGAAILRNTAVYIGHNAGATGLYKMDGGTFNTAKQLYLGNYGTGLVEVVSGAFRVGNQASIGHEASGSGRMRIFNGGVTNNVNIMIGRHGRGYMLVTGGSVVQTADQEFSLGRFADGEGGLDIIGGEYRYALPNSTTVKAIGREGKGL